MDVGALFGDAVDKYNTEQRLKALEQPDAKQKTKQKENSTNTALAYPSDEAPPGQWVMQKGRWVDGKWVPSHKVWQPVNPEEI